MSKINVLVFPAGEINSVELHDALCSCVNINLFGASSIERHGSYIFKNYISGVPLISDENFIEKFNQILEENKIDVIFPTHDSVVDFLCANREKIKAKIVSDDKYTAKICRDKKLTYDLFKDETFCPKIYDDFTKFPVFIKPRKGQGGVGAQLIKSKAQTDNINLDDYVICEYLPGDEVSVDCLTDKNGELKAVMPRLRKRLLAGVCTSGENIELTDEIFHIASKINEKLKFNGLWYFQIKKDEKGKYKLLEISMRVAGTMCLTRAGGVNLPLLSVYTTMGYDVDVIKNPYNIKMDRTLISRYKIDYDYETVYFDFDDTIIINDKVHLPSITYLYQCKNQNKKVILLTKHEKDLNETLKKYLISKELFSQIIHIKPTEEKTEYINPDKAIYIDNAFSERKKVHDKYNIPVFDVEGIEVLADWKI